MREITLRLYKFSELSEEARQNTIEKYRDINTDHEWWDYVYQEWTTKLEALGFDEPDISFSGFYSQGDGASFTCKSVNVWKWILAHKLGIKYKRLKKYCEGLALSAEVYRSDSHYSHEKSVTAQVNTDFDDVKADKLVDEIEKLMDAEVEKLSLEIYKQLESEYDGLTSDASVADTLEANEYDFLEQGGEIQ